MSYSKSLYDAILNGHDKAAIAAVREALASNPDPMELVQTTMIPAMEEVGRLFESEEYFVPELLLSGRAMRGAIDLLRPLLAASGARPIGRVVIGTVAGDLHDIGKNLVASMLQGGGFEVTDLGADVKPQQFIEAVKATNADIVGLSALLTVTMPSMKVTMDALRASGIRDRVKVMIGGAPVTRQYCEAIGADGYCEGAGGVVAMARSFIEARHAN
jgi:5-methyltetrahydrofolate--homocysteine methyltransferase